jgi:hypothetical protein
MQGLPRYDAERQTFHPHGSLQEILGVECRDVYNVVIHLDMSENLTCFSQFTFIAILRSDWPRYVARLINIFKQIFIFVLLCILPTVRPLYILALVSIDNSFIHSFIHQWLYSLMLGPGWFFSFVILYTAGRTPWTGDQPVARPLPTHRTAQTQNKRTQTSMPWVEFEPTIPAFERATVIGWVLV